MLAKAMRLSYHFQLHIYSTGIIYDRHLRSSKYVYNMGHRAELNHKKLQPMAESAKQFQIFSQVAHSNAFKKEVAN
jgi:hypothetical protein